jgi:hypothetical protein
MNEETVMTESTPTPDTAFLPLPELASGLKERLYARRAQRELDRELDSDNHPWKNGSTRSPSAS